MKKEALNIYIQIISGENYMDKSKYIQTEIDAKLHASLKNISEYKKKSLKFVVREAIEEYVKKHRCIVLKFLTL